MADWVHLAPDAAYFRGENDQSTVYTGCATLFKADKWSQRVERATRWHEQARPDTLASGSKDPPWLAAWLAQDDAPDLRVVPGGE